jgi:AcrR family transcriptional regulator
MTEKSKRMGKKDSPAREALIDATERLLFREGFAHVNARSVAAEAGLKKQSLFYYFDSMDELISETHSRHIKEYENGLTKVFACDNPVRALWHLQLHGNGRLFTEFLAIANHNDVLRSTITEANARTNARVVKDFAAFFRKKGIDLDDFPPKAVLFILSSISSNCIIYKDLGILDGEAELLELVERSLRAFDPAAEPHGTRVTGS